MAADWSSRAREQLELWRARVRLEADVRRRSWERALRQRSSRQELARRLNLPPSSLSVGRISPKDEIGATLLALRLATAHAEMAVGDDGTIAVEHTWFPRPQLEWSTTDEVARRRGEVDTFDLSGDIGGIPARLDRMWPTHSGVNFERGWLWFPQSGSCDRVRIGMCAPQRQWHVWLLGLGQGCRRVAVDGVSIEMGTTLAGRKDADLPAVTKATLTFPNDVAADDVDVFLERSLLWLLELFAGTEVVPAGVWAGDGSGGHLTDYNRPLFAARRRVVSSDVPLDQYLAAVLPSWHGLGDDERQPIRFAIGARNATRGADLETSIAVAALTLELLAMEWLTDADKDFGLPNKAARKSIRDAVRAAVSEHAPGSELEQRIDVPLGYLFSRPAAGRFERLFQSLGIGFDPADLTNFVQRRNGVVHAKGGQTEAKVRAMMFGHHMVGRCALAKLEYKGRVYDELRREVVLHE